MQTLILTSIWKAALIPAGVMLGVALLLGIAIALVSAKFAPNKDERAEEIEALLPGSNCGGCGSGGCADFANRLLAGKATLSACRALSKPNRAQIAAILGTEAEDLAETVMIVRCNGGEACKNSFDYAGYDDCVSASQILLGGKACSAGCLGHGNCATACPTSAIKIKYDCAKVKTAICDSCGACEKACPKGLMMRIPKTARVFVACNSHEKGKAVRDVCSRGCIGCGLCAKLCPSQAIKMENNLPVIDYSLCTGCLTCAKKCPTHVIKVR
ncbi:MAG: 4Fe-4S binding protein [Clostridia bacterium]|nr:4Fe-4S binding protein [Clostridia bacterium]